MQSRIRLVVHHFDIAQITRNEDIADIILTVDLTATLVAAAAALEEVVVTEAAAVVTACLPSVPTCKNKTGT